MALNVPLTKVLDEVPDISPFRSHHRNGKPPV